MGKAQTRITPIDRTNSLNIAKRELYGLTRRMGSASTALVGLGNSGGSPSTIQNVTGFLKVAGDTMVGPIAFVPTSKNTSLSGGLGHLDVSNSTGAYSSIIIVNVNPSAGNISYIDGAAFDGQTIWIHIPNGISTTIKNDGNIVPPNNINYTTTGITVIEFQFNSTIAPNGNSGGWIQVNSSTSTSGANTSLSNLISTSINQDLIPQTNKNLGDGTHFWTNIFGTILTLNTSTTITSSTQNIQINVLANKKSSMFFGGTEKVLFDDSQSGVILQGTFVSYNIKDAHGHIGQIAKTDLGPLELGCSDGIQLDNNLTPQNSNTQTIGVNNNPFFFGYFLNHQIVDGTNSAKFTKTNMQVSGSGHFLVNSLTDTTDTTEGFIWQIISPSGTKNYLQINHDAGDPSDYIYAQVPFWLNQTYIQFEEISPPTTPPINASRLYLRDNGSGKEQLVIKWDSGAITVIATEP